MTVQDIIFAAGGLVFAPSLIFTLAKQHKEHKRLMSLGTSIPTAAVLWVFALTFISIGYYYTAITEIASAIIWTMLVRK